MLYHVYYRNKGCVQSLILVCCVFISYIVTYTHTHSRKNILYQKHTEGIHIHQQNSVYRVYRLGYQMLHTHTHKHAHTTLTLPVVNTISP